MNSQRLAAAGQNVMGPPKVNSTPSAMGSGIGRSSGPNQISTGQARNPASMMPARTGGIRKPIVKSHTEP